MAEGRELRKVSFQSHFSLGRLDHDRYTVKSATTPRSHGFEDI